ncbi:MAG: ABC transporter substrate-binding protein, partial [Methanoregulaceae archaeon]|nr:ABC transporter substrate-binding protein [Methanoregulaceae archaeon]
MKRIFVILAVLFIGLVLFAGCTENQAAVGSPQKLKIGVVASMTGPASTTGKDVWQSAVLAADEINAAGGVYVKELGKNVTIELFQGDDESTREGGQKAVSKLITQDNVDLLVGGFSVFLTHSGLAPLPMSVLVKSPVVASGGNIFALFNNLKDN